MSERMTLQARHRCRRFCAKMKSFSHSRYIDAIRIFAAFGRIDVMRVFMSYAQYHLTINKIQSKIIKQELNYEED